MHIYFIAIVLPERLNEKILVYKQFMHERYGCSVGLRSPAHITIIPPYWMNEELEQSLFTDLDRVSSGVNSFVVKTMDFDAFKPRTIFIATAPQPELNKLKSKGDAFFGQAAGYKMKIDKRPFHPHITIATRDLNKQQFAEAWSYFESKHFREEFLTGSLTVLKHDNVRWISLYTTGFR